LPLFDIYTLEDTIQCRRDSPWPILELVAKSFDAISRNPPGTFTSLDLLSFGCFATSTFSQPRWSSILSHLKGFSFSWPCSDNDVRALHANSGFSTEYMRTHFYRHLNALESFRVDANRECVTGETYGDHDELQLELAPDMPWLRRVHFTWMGLDSELVEFMVSRLDRLEVIELDYCVSKFDKRWGHRDNTDECDDPNMWLEFLNSIVEAKPSRLRSLELPALREWDDLITLRNQRKEKEYLDPKVTRRLEQLQSAWEKNDRLFVFGERSLEYGDISLSDRYMMDAAIRGTEQSAYEKVMDIIRSNVQH
jgi:hypothetical protein